MEKKKQTVSDADQLCKELTKANIIEESNGDSALTIVCMKKYEDIAIHILEKCESNPLHKIRSGKTAYSIAKENNLAKFIDKLIEMYLPESTNPLFSDTKCGICCGDIVDDLFGLECGHSFHRKCIGDSFFSWKRQCPLCKKEIVGKYLPKYIPWYTIGKDNKNWIMKFRGYNGSENGEPIFELEPTDKGEGIELHTESSNQELIGQSYFVEDLVEESDEEDESYEGSDTESSSEGSSESDEDSSEEEIREDCYQEILTIDNVPPEVREFLDGIAIGADPGTQQAVRDMIKEFEKEKKHLASFLKIEEYSDCESSSAGDL